MPPPEPFLIFTRKLEELGIRYMVSGSVAAIYYGEPRMTNDVDIIVFLQRSDATRLEAAFPGDDFYCPPREVIQIEIARSQRGHFNLIHHETGFKADIYPVCDELHRWGLSRAQIVELDEDRVSFAPPEYVVVRKLQFYREGGSRAVCGIASLPAKGKMPTANESAVDTSGLPPPVPLPRRANRGHSAACNG